MQSTLRSEALARVYGNLGTLYAKCGGVFGVAAFVDRCMDKWMADPTLNENQAVTTWHQKAQRCGFKFLVVQIVCNLTGGPQVYTGRPIDVAHKHLNISEDEWSVFMEIFNQVCGEFGLAPEVIDDLNALMISMEMDCVVYPGEHVPRDPGPARPAGSSLYARIGGVYPIALFVDRVVDALLDDERVGLPVDTQKRNEASLKYLFTELVCSVCGGPEVVTSRDHDETKLLVPKSAWRIFIATAEVASDHFPRATRGSLLQVLESNKDHIVDPSSAEPEPNSARLDVAAAVKDVRAAAAGRMLSKEAIAARHAAPGALVAARKRVLGDPRTLYGRGGGIFGLARLADALMDKWMSDPELNANARVAKWHESQQTYGFKFLVTQIMGYLTGGPQRYTGRPMEEAHKHLAISGEQWSAFMADASTVFHAFKLDNSTQLELCGILSTYRDSCVLAPGEAAPSDPGLLRPAGNGSTLYQRLGGVYPIAQFVDRLVEKVLVGDRVHVEHDSLDDPSGKRHPPGLKYMLTELVCNGAGGPEVVTSKGFDEAKLGVQAQEWPQFLELASEAAELWPIPHLRNSLVAALGAMKAEICVGVFEEETSPRAKARRLVQDAGFDHYLSSAALEKSAGDPAKALELLARGWTPEDQDAMSMPGSVASLSSLKGGWDPNAPRCPFSKASGSSTALPLGHPPVTGQPAAAPNPPVEDNRAVAARALADRGMTPAQIAALLGMDEVEVAGMLTGAAAHGRVLGNEMQAKLDKLLEEDAEMCCPVSLVLFVEPVIASDGFMYEKASVQGLLKNRMASPMTREALKADFLPARQRRSAAMEFRQARSEELLAFTAEAVGSQPAMAAEALQRATDYIEVLGVNSVPSLAGRTAALWRQLGQPTPTILQDC
mmetsp:Transcript_108176/g.279749  ORF Transcript_108176/g.279749 Transcript_108176/m.279749 type:complete len:891 (+) Transcript_108176:83-2755(+)